MNEPHTPCTYLGDKSSLAFLLLLTNAIFKTPCWNRTRVWYLLLYQVQLWIFLLPSAKASSTSWYDKDWLGRKRIRRSTPSVVCPMRINQSCTNISLEWTRMVRSSDTEEAFTQWPRGSLFIHSFIKYRTTLLCFIQTQVLFWQVLRRVCASLAYCVVY